MAPSKDKWIRRFVISETARHKKGFTIYKVTSVIFLKTSPEAVSKVSVWKRYNDFKKLHTELNAQYASLCIKEPYPPFPKPKFFGRFEADVIEERRTCAIKLLEFVAKYTSLFTSNVFVKFFESSYSDDYATDCSQSISSDTSEDDRNVSSGDSVSVNSPPNVSKNIISTAYCLPKFVCTKQIKPIVKSNNSYECSSEEKPSLGYAKSNLKDNGMITNFNDSDSRNDFNIRVVDMEQKLCDYSNNGEVNVDGNVVTNTKQLSDIRKSNQNEESQSVLQTFTIHDGSDLPTMQEDSAHYILIAAAHMSAAFRHEVIAEYEEAFMQYKLGISNLLNGVQSDPDVNRKSTIKEKISKYLERAERLYNRHLNCNILVLNKPISELQNYKVLKVMGSVMLVRDTLRECDRVIKTLEKPAGSNEDISNYVLRSKVLYMVQLYACIQTETTVFLVLQYASGGKLWEYIKSQYKLCNDKRCSYKKSHTRSISCDAIIQPNSEKKLEISHERLHGNKPKETEYDLEIMENDEIYTEESLRKLEEEFGINSKYNKDVPTQDLLEKAQKLLQSVNATLRRSNSVASRLNESERLLYDRDETDIKIKNSELGVKYSKMFLDSSSINFMHDEDVRKQKITNKKEKSLEPEKDSSKNSRSIDDNENTEDSCDLSELSTSDSYTDLSTSKDKIANVLLETSSPEISKSQCFVTERLSEGDINLLTYNSVNESRVFENTCKADANDLRSQEVRSKDYPSGMRTVENLRENEILSVISKANCSDIAVNIGRNFEVIVKESSIKNAKSSQDKNDVNQLQAPTRDDSNVEMEQIMWKLPENTVKLWAAEILSALESLHQQNVMILDLRPDNILLEDNGHVAMTYAIPRHNGKLPQPCRPYTSPELCMFSPTIPASTAADVWSFGVLLYELLTGIQFQWRHPGLFHSHSIINIPEELSQNATSLLSSILKYEPSERLTIPEIKRHPFFENVDWPQLLNP